jgi:D-3-phosphoglycerate dehydrogenase
MPKFRVLLTDYAWNDLDIERRVLADGEAELVVAPAGDAETLAGLAADCDAIMTNWAKVPEAVIAACSRCQIVARLLLKSRNTPWR